MIAQDMIIVEDFSKSLDTQSVQTRDRLIAVCKNFLREVGIANMLNASKVNEWIQNHEYGKPNNINRYFLMKFADYLEIDSGPLRAWKLKRLPDNLNPKVFSKHEKDQIIEAAKSLNSVHCSGLLLFYYLRLLDIGALRKSEPLTIRYKDFVHDPETLYSKVLVKGKGNKQRWIQIPGDLYFQIITYCIKNDIDGNDYLFEFTLDQLNTMYKQVCRIAKKNDMLSKGLDYRSKEAQDKHQGYCTRDEYVSILPNGSERKNVRWNPVYSLHKFRRFRIQYWYKVDKISLIEIMHRAGHSSVEVTKRYINEGDDIYLGNWGDSVNTPQDKKMASWAEEARQDAEIS